MKLVSWNVNGLRACVGKGFFEFLAAENPDELESVRMLAEESLENVFTVSQYDRRVKMYLYTFETDGLLYTFSFTGAGRAEFVMYALEKS